MIISVVTLPTGQLVTVGAQDVMVYTVVIFIAEVIVVREFWPGPPAVTVAVFILAGVVCMLAWAVFIVSETTPILAVAAPILLSAAFSGQKVV